MVMWVSLFIAGLGVTVIGAAKKTGASPRIEGRRTLSASSLGALDYSLEEGDRGYAERAG